MNTALTEKTTSALAAMQSPAVSISNVTQEGANNLNVEVVEKFITNSTFNIVMNTPVGNRTVVLNTNYCNIFVIDGETFAGNCFTIPKKSVLPENFVAADIRERFANLDAEVTRFPSLFMSVNGDYRRCADPNQEFFYGIVTEVSRHKGKIKVVFQRMSTNPMYQRRLNDIAVSIGINSNNGLDALDKTGWIIKEIDILRVLTANGIPYT